MIFFADIGQYLYKSRGFIGNYIASACYDQVAWWLIPVFPGIFYYEIGMIKAGLYSLVTIFLLVLSPCKASPLDDSAFETISISADEASEDIQPGILHFSGHFLMQSRDWQLESGRATVYGPPNRPDKIYLEGSPARFLVNRSNGEEGGAVEATAPVVEYLRSTNMLVLSGGAMLKLDDEVIESTVIEYDISTDRYRAGGADGVKIEVPPVD
jgi:lipopolysaccharide transport protein LptA